MNTWLDSLRSLFEKNQQAISEKLLDCGKFSLQLDALEPRVLFSAAPVEAPQEPTEAEVSQAPAEVATEQGQVADQTGLSQEAVDAIAAEAKQRWVDSGLSQEQVDALNSITYRIEDLGGERLGAVEGTIVTIDDDAAGRGWFVDATPEDDAEFTSPLSATIPPAGIDLLSVILHEQGHILGLDHEDASSDSVMSAIFHEGQRHLPSQSEADGAVPGLSVGIHYATAPVANDDGGVPFTISEDGILHSKTYAETVIESDPLIYWQLNEADKSAGQSAVNAATGASSFGSAADGTYGGTVGTASDTPFSTVSAGTFDGSPVPTGSTGDQVTLNPIPAGFPSTELSYEIWIKSAPTENGDGIVSYDITGQGNEALLFNQANLTLYIENVQRSSGVSVNDGKWHHVVANWRSSDGLFEIYKDGILSHSSTGFQTGADLEGGGRVAS